MTKSSVSKTHAKGKATLSTVTRSGNLSSRKYSGFTLVELIMVMVIVGIIGAITTSFIVSTLESYRSMELRSKLVAHARVAIEQMTRQVRGALPYSVRVSGSGNCVEFFPIVAGASYEGEVADSDNGAPLTTTVNSAPFNTQLGTARHLAIGAMAAAEIYTTAVPASRVDIGPVSGGPFTSVTLATSHRFVRNSTRQRMFLLGDPSRFCLVGSDLIQYENYDFDTGALSDAAPSNTETSLIAEDVSSDGTAFTLSAGSEDRNAALIIDLRFTERDESVALQHQVSIRNVP